MSEREKWVKVVETVNIPRTMHPTMWPFNDAQEGIAWAASRLRELEEENAKLKAIAERAKGITNFIRREKLYDHPGDAEIIGPKMESWLNGGK